MNNKEYNNLPNADHIILRRCPNCGFYGESDMNAAIHETIKKEYTEKGDLYYHCTNCNCNFVES